MLTLRPATPHDVALLEEWDTRPHVVRATTDDPLADSVESDWPGDLAIRAELGADVWEILIAELDGRPIGVVQVIDPYREPTGYWRDWAGNAPGLRALDIWIGEEELLGHGHGTEMMRQAIRRVFADAAVTALVIDPLASNAAAHRFYHRLGFVDVGPHRFADADDCVVMRLARQDWHDS